MPKALISTIAPIFGGVPQMAAFIAALLREGGYDVSFAYYQPYSLSPELSVSLHRLALRREKKRQNVFRGCRAHAIGARMPELEFTHYWPTNHWRELIDLHDVHLSVSGNCLAATPFAMTEIPFWAWTATGWEEDRVQRSGEFSWYRKILDRLVTTFGAKILERKILDSDGTIVALSEHTNRVLSSLSERPKTIGLMPMGIDTNKFRPFPKINSRTSKIGFVGRLDDPRKNVDLLLRALALCIKNGTHVSATLVGEGEQQEIKRKLDSYGLGDSVTIVDYIENDRLPTFLAQMDVFVIPSHQEGLCIAALEAMSCGVPVISTSCGGPEEYVINDKTGCLVDHDAKILAEAIMKVLSDSQLRQTLGNNARSLVESKYSIAYVKNLFWTSFNNTFPSTVGRNSFR